MTTKPSHRLDSWRGPILLEAAQLLLSLGVGGLVWVLSLQRSWIWVLALLPYLVRHLYLLVRLDILIRRHRLLTPPFPSGLWGEVYRTIAQHQQRGRKGRQRQIRFTRRFREAANAVPDALVILDRQHRIEWANPAAATLMNLHWPEDDGRLFIDILNHPGLRGFLEAGDYSRPLDIAPDHNRALMLSLRIAPFGERKRQRLVVGRDITKVYHLNMIRRDFVANASHELRTPLTVIAGFLENLTDSPATPPNHRRPLELMHNQAERMRSIIEDLLTLSRLEMAERVEERDTVPVDVPEELQRILQEAQALSGGGHDFITDIDPDLLLVANEQEILSAFSNLIFNAVKHTPQGTHVQIRWLRGVDGPELRVQDNGQGIAPEHLPRLTERFYRIDKARSRESGGTGLGLAIVKHALSRHDAHLLIASEVGQGTSFTCVFPTSRGLTRETNDILADEI